MKKPGALTYGLLVVLGILFAFPLFWLLITSVRSNGSILQRPEALLGSGLHPSNYSRIVPVLGVGREVLNSAIMTVGATIGTVALAAPAGYAFARLRLPGGGVLFAVLIAAMVIPFEAIFIPLYLMLAHFGMVNTYQGLILPVIGSPFAIFVFRQYYLSIPEELIEAMSVDGAGPWRRFVSMFVPMSGPPLAAVGILTFLTQWNNFLEPLVFTTSPNMYTLQVGLGFLNTGPFAGVPKVGWLMAGVVLSIVVPIGIFLLLQERFVKSMVQSGLK